MIARILVLPASAHPASRCARLADEATRLLALADDVTLTQARLADYPLPLFEADAGPDARDPVPENARLLAGRLALQDALLLVAPPALPGGGLAPMLANMLNWTARAGTAFGLGERPAPRPFARLVVGLAAATAGPGDEAAGRQMLATLRLTLADLGAAVVSPVAVVPDAALAPGDRRLADPDSRLALETLVDTLLDHARALGRQP